ncbi:hypothetical protein HPP92_015919 [Vanilla planifolia]|uniref:Uncharacterized protein n=1 Tax=Vanilla planifolia TaxID=51239 RepID=A0A835QH53_VANPL|nr:hypothetical protein HPP92_015919 [Vanilla planifolia]
MPCPPIGSSQSISATSPGRRLASFFTAVLRLHSRTLRRLLWEDLLAHSSSVGSDPWWICGDFNVSFHSDDVSRTARPRSLVRTFANSLTGAPHPPVW